MNMISDNDDTRFISNMRTKIQSSGVEVLNEVIEAAQGDLHNSNATEGNDSDDSADFHDIDVLQHLDNAFTGLDDDDDAILPGNDEVNIVSDTIVHEGQNLPPPVPQIKDLMELESNKDQYLGSNDFKDIQQTGENYQHVNYEVSNHICIQDIEETIPKFEENFIPILVSEERINTNDARRTRDCIEIRESSKVLIQSVGQLIVEDTDESESSDESVGTFEKNPPLNLNHNLNDSDDELEQDLDVVKIIVAEMSPRSTPKIPPTKSTSPNCDPKQQSIEDYHKAQLEFFHAKSDVVDEVTTRSTKRVEIGTKNESVTFGIKYTNVRTNQIIDIESVPVNLGSSSYSGKNIVWENRDTTSENCVSQGGYVDSNVCSLKNTYVQEGSDEFAYEEVMKESETKPECHNWNTDLYLVQNFEQKRKEGDAAMLEALRQETKALRASLHMEISTITSTGQNPEHPNMSQATDLTLTELHGMYKKGLGDQRIRLMHESYLNTSQSTNSETASPKLFRGTETLSEEDEVERFDHAESSSNDIKSIASNTNESGQWIEVDLKPYDGSFDSVPTSNKAQILESSPLLIKYDDALHYFLTGTYFTENSQLDIIEVEEKPQSTICSCFLKYPKLTFPHGNHDRERIFCSAATPFNSQDLNLVKLLQSIYRLLMSKDMKQQTVTSVPLIGGHWEAIGFQGCDPSTDLRGCGVFALLQMLYLIENYNMLSLKLLRMSQHPTRHFPLACVWINITLHCLNSLRQGHLISECNRLHDVWTAMHRLHIAISVQLVEELSLSQETNEEFPFIMKRVLEHGRDHPDSVIHSAFTDDGKLKKIGLVKDVPSIHQSDVTFTPLE